MVVEGGRAVTSGAKRALREWMAELTRQELLSATTAMQRDAQAQDDADAADDFDCECCGGCSQCLPDTGFW